MPTQLSESGLSEDILSSPFFCRLEVIRGIPLVFEHLENINIGSKNNFNHSGHFLMVIIVRRSGQVYNH